MIKRILWGLSIFFVLLCSSDVFCEKMSVEDIESRLDTARRATDKEFARIIRQYVFLREQLKKTNKRIWLDLMKQFEVEGRGKISELIIKEFNKAGSVEDAIFPFERLQNRNYVDRIANLVSPLEYSFVVRDIIRPAITDAVSRLANNDNSEETFLKHARFDELMQLVIEIDDSTCSLYFF